MKIIWTKKAEGRFIEILGYIEEKFGKAARQHFKIKTKEFTVLLREFPEIGNTGSPRQEFKRVSTYQTDKGLLQNKEGQDNYLDIL